MQALHELESFRLRTEGLQHRSLFREMNLGSRIILNVLHVKLNLSPTFRLTIPTDIAISGLTPMEVIPHILKWGENKDSQLGKYPSAVDGRNCNSSLHWVSTTDPNT